MSRLKEKIPNLRKPDANEIRQQREALRTDQREQTKRLIDQMILACQEDHQKIIDRSGPALSRIKLIGHMDSLLKIKPI
jgi:hypothetical protein